MKRTRIIIDVDHPDNVAPGAIQAIADKYAFTHEGVMQIEDAMQGRAPFAAMFVKKLVTKK